jgi:hypothetical protein
MTPWRGNNSLAWVLHLRRDSSSGPPTGGLVKKALVPHDGFVTGPPHGARQQFLDVRGRLSFAGSRIAYFTPRFFQRLVDLRLGKRGIGPKNNFLTHTLLTFDLGKKQLLPSPPHYARCPVADSLPDNLLPR